ncbi:MAG: hypothetical protein MR531_10705 [Lachnospiraceae bacterium]|nr:hypothetical protein [Lachnospiraceae bacterium]
MIRRKSLAKALARTGVSVGNAANTYTVKSVDVTVTDGQLTCDFTAGATSRLDAIIVRLVKAEEDENTGEEESGEEESGKEESGEGESDKEESAENKDNGGSSNNSMSGSSSVDTGSADTPNITIAKKPVIIVDENAPLAEAVTTEGLPYVDVTPQAKNGKLKAELLQKYYGRNLYLMTHLGNGIGYTIDASMVTSDTTELELSSYMEEIKDFASGFTTKHFIPVKEAALPYSICIHMQVGAEYAGKTTYIFSKNFATGLYELRSVTAVNEIGNVALQTREMTEIIIMIVNE